MKFSDFSTIFTLLVLFTCYNAIHSLDSPCGTWAPFKDEKCFGILDDTVRTFADAESACSKLENSLTLPLIHSAEEQEFLSNFLFKTSKKVANFWLGAKVVNSKVAWIDNSDLGYTNWDPKGPRNKTNYCVQMEYDESVVGKWIDEPCETKNLVVCQRMQTWSMAVLQKTLLETRKKLDALDGSKQHENNPIPIGFIYTQLPNEASPASIWPSMSWSDVSASYAGIFFRVEGGHSETFGKTQEENYQRLIRVERSINSNQKAFENYTIDATNVSQNTKASNWIYAGAAVKVGYYEQYYEIRYVTSTGEIRPRNMAIRIWKRTA